MLDRIKIKCSYLVIFKKDAIIEQLVGVGGIWVVRGVILSGLCKERCHTANFSNNHSRSATASNRRIWLASAVRLERLARTVLANFFVNFTRLR